ncbi:amino acid/polyamine transporter I [Halteromyces radiatus]|uniref:amino acid/polyamine transporter I n=1 Tax=Halteromyces radiatus TaxID=101107 RepID=UPI00221EA4B8|nr:amino acid/polyamine transporter I [Halteromyces radiatus]KAI8097349.1 amino acid/polyamine transporter I [Halteromyces radiatus]
MSKDQPSQLGKLAPMAIGDQKLGRHIGFFSGTVMNVGEIIGSGIFSNPSYILKNTGSGGMMLILWIVGALTSVSGLLTFLELGTMLPRSGGEKTYIGYIYHKPNQLLSFIFMVMVGICTRCGSLAQGSIVFGDNMVYAMYGGNERNEWASRGFGGILPNRPSLTTNFSFNGTVQNAGSYANAIYFNLPRCGATSIAFATVVYLLANCAYLSVLSLEMIKSSDLTVAAHLFNVAFGGTFGSHVLPVFVGLSSFGMVGVIVYSASRVILEFAREGHLPFDRYFSKVHPTLQTPVPALLLLYGLSLVFLLGPPPGTVFEFIIAFTNYGEYFFAALCAIGIFILRHREPDLKRPIRAPTIFVFFFIAVCIFTIVFVFLPPTHAPASYPYYGN